METRERVQLQAFNTLAVPAVAEHFAELTDPADLEALLALAREHDWPVRVLGEGSNVVLGATLLGLTLRQCVKGIELIAETPDSVTLEVTGGENWHEFVRWCLERGYYGLENLALIPGTVGAAPIQNIGAYGVDIAPFIEKVRGRELPSGGVREFNRTQCEFGYRDSVFKHEWRDRLLIESVTLNLSRKPQTVCHYPSLAQYLGEQAIESPSPQQVFDAVVAIRSTRLPDPAKIPNVGSFFKNPKIDAQQLETLLARHADMPHWPDGSESKLAAAWLIEQCGFKQRRDPVRVHAEHALVITNPARRPAAEIATLAAEIVAAVEARFDIRLEQEPRSYGELDG